jgi:hypothetical protein
MKPFPRLRLARDPDYGSQLLAKKFAGRARGRSGLFTRVLEIHHAQATGGMSNQLNRIRMLRKKDDPVPDSVPLGSGDFRLL